MSKTDKDLPYWVLAERHGVPLHRHLSRRGVPIACDLGAPARGFDACFWTLPRMRWSNCPSTYSQLTYYSPDRARVRNEVDALRREYNSYGELDDGDVVCRQHRHCGSSDRE